MMWVRKKQGFTLIELLMTIALSSIVIGIIFGLIGPLHQGIVNDQSQQKANLELEHQTQVLSHSLLNAQSISAYQSMDQNGGVGSLIWLNERGDQKEIIWNKKELTGDFNLNHLENFELICDSCFELIDGLSSRVHLTMDMKTKKKYRLVKLTWRP